MSAEEEKLRLFQQAQAAVQKNQGLSYTPPSGHVRNGSELSQSSAGGSGKPPTAAANLYAQAISAQGRSAAGPGPSASNATPPRTKPAVPQYLTAEQEKAALRMYEEAKRAVDRTQNSEYDEPPPDPTPASSAPIAYESLFPAAASSSRPSGTDEPPPFNSSVIPQSHLSEKERLRRAYEANDAAARARQNAPTPPNSPPTHGQYTNALEEKEALRKKFEERDNAQARGTVTPQTSPLRAGNGHNTNSTAMDGIPSPGRSPTSATGSRPTPLPPAAATARVLTAAEEKALLRAKFEARDAQANRKPSINGINSSAPSESSTLPPLMPRPPVEYIKETQEEDARVSRLNMNGAIAMPEFDPTPSHSRRGTPVPYGATSDLNGGGINGKHDGRLAPSSPLLPNKPVGE
jgi:hypothetical protein